MKRTLVVLALTVLSTAGCRAIGPQGYGCGDPCCGDAGCSDYGYEGASCDPSSPPSHVVRSQCAPRPGDCGNGYGEQYGRGGNLEQSCPGGDCCLFNRYCGHNGGPGYGPGPYDCSPCGSPNWGCTGYRHPQGTVTGHECYCDNQCAPPASGAVCGNGYCCAVCGRPAPACCCNSGDHNYNFNPGPPVAQTAYPYYTVRGPRDFLLSNPPPLGPY